MQHRTIYLDGYAVVAWPNIGSRILSTNSETFSLNRGGSTPVAEMADFRFYDHQVSKADIDTIRTNWLSAHQGCGDGERNFNEQCDDGNHVSGDGCSKNCQR